MRLDVLQSKGEEKTVKTPPWAQLLYRFSRALTAVDVGQQILRDELFFAFLAPSQRDVFTVEAYSRSRHYLPGGDYFGAGLWPWEEALLECPRVPRFGRVLLSAAGGGRELHALLERGYEVFAFEPVASMFECARGIAQGKNAQVVQANYDDLVMRAEGRPGRLHSLAGRFDLCILGWGSLSHMTEPDVVVDTLRALRNVAPGAPVVVSFVLRAAVEDAQGGARRLRKGVRRALGAFRARAVPPGLRFANGHGFFYEFSVGEVTELCARGGYAVERFSEWPYPHALLVPVAGAV